MLGEYVILAKLKYLSQRYEVIEDGTHVLCSVTGKPIALEDLIYWSVERQEPYFGIEESLQRHKEVEGV
jgi:hypothetical protein